MWSLSPSWKEHQPGHDVQYLFLFFFRVKKGWWDQIPNPAHSPLVAIVIQDSQVGAWAGDNAWDCLGRR